MADLPTKNAGLVSTFVPFVRAHDTRPVQP